MAPCVFIDMAGHILDSWDLWERTVWNSFTVFPLPAFESVSWICWVNDFVFKNLKIYFPYSKIHLIVDSNTAFVPSVFSRRHPLLLLIHCANASLLALLSFESASVDSLGITSPTLTTPHLTHQLYPTPQCERGCLKPGHWRGIWQHHHLLRKIILIAMIPTLIACIMNILWTWRGYWLSSPSEILHMIGW